MVENNVIERLQVKIGARNLTEKAMEVLLPQYKQIEAEIENMRKNAEMYHKRMSGSKNGRGALLDREYQNNVNNVISILGGRGSGKTSVLLTVKHKLDYQTYENDIDAKDKDTYIGRNNNDIILPTILPETMGENSDLLGWILGAFENVIVGLEKEIESGYVHEQTEKFDEFFDGCRIRIDNPIRKAYNDVLKFYRYTKKDYQEYIVKDFESFNGYLDSAKNIMDPQNRLILVFHTFIETIVEWKKEISNQQSMVFLFIDDIDLSCERCKEVVDVIIRYLSHPNIVTFIAGDFESFRRVLLLNHLNSMNIIDVIASSGGSENDRQKELLSSYKKLVNDNLKKILPPSLRFRLQNYTYDKRLRFNYDDNYDLGELIDIVFGVKDSKGGWNISKAYGVIFDSYPRGLMNVYYELYLMMLEIQQLEKQDDKKTLLNKRGECLCKLINVIIRSSTDLSDFDEEKIMKCITVNREDYNQSWIDFAKAKNIESTDCDDDKKTCLFTLLNFVENIIGILFEQQQGDCQVLIKRDLHGAGDIYEQLSKKLNGGEVKYLPRFDDISLQFECYQAVTKDVSFEALMKPKHVSEFHNCYLTYFEILQSLLDNGGEDKKLSEKELQSEKMERFRKILDMAYSSDIEWVQQIYEMVFWCKNILRVLWIKVENSMWEWMGSVDDNLKNSVLKKFLTLLEKANLSDEKEGIINAKEIGVGELKTCLNKVLNEQLYMVAIEMKSIGEDITRENYFSDYQKKIYQDVEKKVFKYRVHTKNKTEMSSQNSEQNNDDTVNMIVYVLIHKLKEYIDRIDLSPYVMFQEYHYFLEGNLPSYKVFIEGKKETDKFWELLRKKLI